MLCQAEASYASAGGDSGSPVFWEGQDGTLTDVGIHWGHGGIFSPHNAVNFELRTVLGGGIGSTIGELP
jgi:secreted trypsin-like serine protease